MPAGSPLRNALVRLIKEVQAELSVGNPAPVQGYVAVVNDDGTVDVQGNDGNYYPSVGYPDQQPVLGLQVVIVTGNGVQAAVPYVAPGGAGLSS